MGTLQLQDQHYLLSCPDLTTFRKIEDVSRLLQGIFNLRKSLPKHTAIYDPDEVLSYNYERIPENQQLNLELLTKKLATLLCLL